MHLAQEQPFRRGRGRRNQTRARCGEKLRKVVERPPVPSDLHHGPHEVPDHMVEKSVGPDLEGHTHLVPGHPVGLRHSAAVPSGLLPDFRKRLERMLTEKD